ncbi:hypothetical protein [Nostoc sp.]
MPSYLLQVLAGREIILIEERFSRYREKSASGRRGAAVENSSTAEIELPLKMAKKPKM